MTNTSQTIKFVRVNDREGHIVASLDALLTILTGENFSVDDEAFTDCAALEDGQELTIELKV